MAYYVLSYCVSFIFSGYGNTGLAHLAHWCGVRVSHPFDDDPVYNTIGYWIPYLMMNAECQCIGNPDEGILPVLKTAEEIKPPTFACYWKDDSFLGRSRNTLKLSRMVAISTYWKNTIIFGAFLRVYLTCIIKDLICHWIFLYHYY